MIKRRTKPTAGQSQTNFAGECRTCYGFRLKGFEKCRACRLQIVSWLKSSDCGKLARESFQFPFIHQRRSFLAILDPFYGFIVVLKAEVRFSYSRVVPPFTSDFYMLRIVNQAPNLIDDYLSDFRGAFTPTGSNFRITTSFARFGFFQTRQAIQNECRIDSVVSLIA